MAKRNNPTIEKSTFKKYDIRFEKPTLYSHLEDYCNQILNSEESYALYIQDKSLELGFMNMLCSKLDNKVVSLLCVHDLLDELQGPENMDYQEIIDKYAETKVLLVQGVDELKDSYFASIIFASILSSRILFNRKTIISGDGDYTQPTSEIKSYITQHMTSVYIESTPY